MVACRLSVIERGDALNSVQIPFEALILSGWEHST